MFILKELLSWIILFIIIITNTAIDNNSVNNILFTLFYILTYTLCTNKFLSLPGVVVLGLVFDSINNISIGVSSTILIVVSLIYLLENKMATHFIVKYILGLINLIVLICYIKLMEVLLDISFINLITFYIIGVIIFSILLPIVLITNKILANVK